MKELIEALTRAANAVADHYEGKAPVDRRFTTEPAPEKQDSLPKKTRVKKEVAPEAPVADVGLDLDAAPAKSAKKGEMTEEESAKAVTDNAKLLVAKFNKPGEAGKPEGFYMAKKLLVDDFKVGRLSDLSHEQRVEFVKQVKVLLTKETAGV